MDIRIKSGGKGRSLGNSNATLTFNFTGGGFTVFSNRGLKITIDGGTPIYTDGTTYSHRVLTIGTHKVVIQRGNVSGAVYVDYLDVYN